ncbi:Pre-mRNA-splicing factor CWC26 [Coniochaeta sp. 2T2.1]|nr:Pre-mRNA-splicing factor CWC26 [Coniochaeta sp. 2T2.1]
MPDLNSYLAAHYLTSDPKPTKKRKRKTTGKSEPSGLLIADDDEPGWTKPRGSDDDNDDPELQTTVAGTSAEFRRAKKSAWKTLDGAPAKKNNSDTAAEADAILASAAAEAQAAGGGAGDDEAPAVADGDGDVKMSDGTFAGLQSAKAISAQLARRREEEMAELEAIEKEKKARKKKRRGEEDEDEEDQVVLRDATGRRVDVSMARADARRAAAEAEEKARRDEEARKRALKGDVQLEEARKRREQLEDAALMPLARGKDDEELNRELKAARRWNDPMAQFLEPDDVPAAGGAGKTKAGGGGGKSRRPVYKGACPPNRYGIRPGYRWDGVDRGNGFEAERFKALNRRERNKGLEYAWQADE